MCSADCSMRYSFMYYALYVVMHIDNYYAS